MEKYRYERSLPVVAVDDVRLEVDYRHDRENCLAEESKALDVELRIGIRSVAAEIIFVVNKVICYSVHFVFHDTDMEVAFSLAVVHIEMVDVLEVVSVLLRNESVVRHYDCSFVF